MIISITFCSPNFQLKLKSAKTTLYGHTGRHTAKWLLTKEEILAVIEAAACPYTKKTAWQHLRVQFYYF